MKDSVFIVILSILLVTILTLILTGRDEKIQLDKYRKENRELKDKIKIQSDLILYKQEEINLLILKRENLEEKINTLLENDHTIKKKYEEIYMSVDTVDWNKLDSLSSIVIGNYKS